jgi:uncharacterized membrane protein
MENMAFVSMANNLVTYFSALMHYPFAESANMITNYMGTLFLLTLVGGFISDSFLTRFWTIISFASAELLVRTLNLALAFVKIIIDSKKIERLGKGPHPNL